MADYKTTETSKPYSGDCGNRVVYQGKASVSAALAIADTVKMCIIPGGTKVDRVVVKNGDLDSGTTLTDKIGFKPMDGSTVTNSDVAFCASGATTRQAAATTTYEIFPPVVVEKDSWLVLTCVAAATGLAATVDVHGKVEGEILGKK